MVIDLEVVIKEFLGSLDLLRTQTLYIHESIKVVIVNKNDDLIVKTFYIVPPALKRLNNG